ncbi:glycosyltransferase [Metabacillus sp. KIGAM252]|uniref:Glycosyltransferase n=1 Tax=Metabacillus flavus TaxID=2823519 RepID=A0ABS5LB00_9BACI|nr:glycosyltransferase family 2 protein [Metabacillus flavus]MBS2967891.1 glycosyltransferase [Metabacillus flavus]
MIVKNEESSIERCLKSVEGIVSEKIIVDTGSEDRTIELCKEHQAHVFPYEWNDSFADARNFGLTHASGDWILWLDADEELGTFEKEDLTMYLSQAQSSILSLPVIHYYGDALPVQTNQAHLYHQNRLFKNQAGIKFYNRIHEIPLLPNGADEKTDILALPVHHYGYLKEIAEKKQKSSRNLRLLEIEAEEPGHSPWIEYHLASEYYRHGKIELAFALVNQSILKFIQEGKMPPSMLYKLKYTILLDTNNTEGTREGLEKALLLYPDYTDLHFYKGMILYQERDFDEAIRAFDTCLELGENHPHHLILKGAGSFKAWNCKGLCLERLGRIKESQEAFAMAGGVEWQNQEGKT